MSRFVQQLKGRSSTRIKCFLCDELTAYAARISQQDPIGRVRFHAFEIETRRKLEEKVTYMHLNPVRAGLVEKAVDWTWSSARWYLEHRTVGVPMEWGD